eukprot:6188366-Pleurochrysis_carterae.AAC.1
MEAPLPIVPTLTFAPASATAAASGPTTRSMPAGTASTTAACGTAPVSSVRPLTPDEKDHFVVSPEQRASVDRQLMETIFSTITSPATRPAYRTQCQNSGRSLIRILVAEANASSPFAGLAIESIMYSQLLKGLTNAFVTEFNALQHAFARLNRSLPAHAQLGGALIAKKLCAVVRRLRSESINTILDVKLVMKSATGNLPLTLATIRECSVTSRLAKRSETSSWTSPKAVLSLPSSWVRRTARDRLRHATATSVATLRVTLQTRRARQLLTHGPIDLPNAATAEGLIGIEIVQSGTTRRATEDKP